MVRLSVFMSHPIQYQVSLLRKISDQGEIDLGVYFYWDFGIEKSYDPEFGNDIKWDLPLLEGYRYKFLKNISWIKGTNFFGCINPGAIYQVLSKRQDVVLVFGWALLTNWLVIIAAFLTRTPVLLYGESPEMHETKRKGIYKAVRRALLKGLFLLIDGFMYIGSENKKFYQSMGVKDSKLFFCPYSVDNDRHYMAAKKLMSDKERVNDYELKKDMTIILFVGKLIEKKRPMDLLQAFHLMEGRGSRKKAMLWFVGDGQQREDLERYAEENHLDNVAFMGFQNQTELPYFYFMSDVFVLPSGYGETWGLVVNEAMCYSLPVIVSDRVGCGGDLVTSKNGYIFEYSNKKQLAQCLDRLVSDSSLRESFGSESLRVIRKYNQDLAANNILEAANSVSCK